MKIKDSLPQFDNTQTLLVVTGKEHAEFYVAKDGIIEPLERIEVKAEDLGEVADRFETRTSGFIVSGADEERVELEVREFLDRFEREFPRISSEADPEQIYLFAPQYMSKEIMRRFPNPQKELIKAHFDGIYSDKHLFDLLEMIQSIIKENEVETMSSEARKLYDRFPQDEV